MTQTLAILHEAYRNLNSKKLFWVALLISGIGVAAFACVGINPSGIKILFWQIDLNVLNSELMSPSVFYKEIFVSIGIGFWLSWLATILALVSTAGIFPDLIGSGSIDLLVSKPISRLRLFITEYLVGLLFVALQTTVFSLASFLVMGLRGGVWEPGLFLAIPLIVCFFSYLFAVCVLLGILTRSTVAALLLTLLFWFLIWMLGAAETGILTIKTMREQGVDFSGRPAEPARFAPKPSGSAGKSENGDNAAAGHKDNAGDVLDVLHRVLYGVKTVLPKTTETVALLERTLIDVAELPKPPGRSGNLPQQRRLQTAQQEVIEAVRARSVGWVVGTSLGFEAIVLAWAAVVFCRRDY